MTKVKMVIMVLMALRHMVTAIMRGKSRSSLILKNEAVGFRPQVLHLLELRFKPDIVCKQLVEYLCGVDARTVLLPLLHDLGAHHVQLLLHVLQTVVQATQSSTVFTNGEVPIEHGFRFWRQGGEGVVVVWLPEHLQLRGRLPLLTGSAHRR